MLLALSLVLPALAAACGADEPDEAGVPPEVETRLEIAVWPEGEREGELRRYTLTCDPPGGDHPDPEAACAALERLGAEAFEPVPSDAICTQVYGGPMEARVEGVVAGQPVDAHLAYTDGCQIARWDVLADVVPRPEGGLA
jgi:hypothetical protein